MPECTKRAYQTCRKIDAVDRILIPRLLNEEWYTEKINGVISKNDDFFMQISKEMTEFFTESSLLLCGFENDVPEIYIISDPGVLNSASPEGFGVVGIGEDTAKNRLFTLGTDPGNSLGSVLYDAYDAKESCAEALPDVGHEWNAVILVQNKQALPVPDNIVDLIERLYKNHPRSPFDPRSRPPRDWRQQLNAWSDDVLRRGELTAPVRQLRSLGSQRDC
jgi:hypothetical protein